MFLRCGHGKFEHSGGHHKTAAHHPGSGKGFLVQLATFKIKIDQTPVIADFQRLHFLATLHELTAYDVAYLDLAKRLSLPLATRDGDLMRAASSEGIQIL
jgi:predicted nucleic acid-binding protein